MQSKFTVWVKSEQRADILAIVCEVPDVSTAIQQALEQAAQRWACAPDALFVYGVAEGDVSGA